MSNNKQTFTFKLTDENDVGFFWKAEFIEEIQSKYQNIKIIKHDKFGKALLLDDYIMFCEYDEHKYHELISYVPLEFVKKETEVLVVGGGDTLTVKRLLNRPVKNITMFEIDSDVVEICKKHFPNLINTHLNDPRLKIHFSDALKAVPKLNSYDLILLDIQDCRDEEMASHVLFTETFYSQCKDSLTGGGILVAQISCPYLLEEHFNSQSAMLKKLFKNTLTYGAYMHCYGMHQYFIMCSDSTEFPKEKLNQIELNFDWEYKLFN